MKPICSCSAAKAVVYKWYFGSMVHPPCKEKQDLDWKMSFCPGCGMHFAFSAAISSEGPPCLSVSGVSFGIHDIPVSK